MICDSAGGLLFGSSFAVCVEFQTDSGLNHSMILRKEQFGIGLLALLMLSLLVVAGDWRDQESSSKGVTASSAMQNSHVVSSAVLD